MPAAVVAPVDEALGVDQRIDRLVDERPGEPAVAQRAPRVRRDDRLEPRGAALGARRGAVHRGELALGGDAEHLDEQLGLGREVPVEGAGGDAGALGDRAAPTRPRSRPPRAPRAPPAPGARACRRVCARRAGAAARGAVGAGAAVRVGRAPRSTGIGARVERRVQRRGGSGRSRPRSGPNSKNSFAPLARPRWIAQATSRSSAAPASTRSPRALQRRLRPLAVALRPRSVSDVGDAAGPVDGERLEHDHEDAAPGRSPPWRSGRGGRRR